MKAVILAAGRGKRLNSFTKSQPKPLTPILGKPIIEHTLDTLKNVGISNCIIVTGYLGKLIQKRLGNGSEFNIKIQYCHNPQYMSGNAISLKTAEKHIKNNEQFLLLMADHYVSQEIIKEALKKSNYKRLLCVDKNPAYPPQIKDATKVLVNSEGYIVDIGKKIPLWNAVDTGVFILDNSIFKIIKILERTEKDLTITRCVKQSALNGKPLWACNVSGKLWFDIDTKEDVIFVESFLYEALKCQETGME